MSMTTVSVTTLRCDTNLCGETRRIERPVSGKWVRDLAAEVGWSTQGEGVEIRDLCPACTRMAKH